MYKEISLKQLKSPESLPLKVTPIVPDETMVDLANWVSELTSNAGTMLPKTEEQVLEMFSQSRSVILLDEEGNPVAHSAITFIYENQQVVELGGVIVTSSKRKKGLGTLAAQAAMSLADTIYPGWKKLALCNDASLPIFVALGGKIVTYDDLADVPVEAWEACKTCPNYAAAKAQGKICCDTPVIMP